MPLACGSAMGPQTFGDGSCGARQSLFSLYLTGFSKGIDQRQGVKPRSLQIC